MPAFSNLLRDERNVQLHSPAAGGPAHARVRARPPHRNVGARSEGAAAAAGRSGVIRGYRLELDPAALGLPVTVYVRVRPAAGQLPRMIELAQSLPQVVECHRITGEDCFIVKVHLDAIENLDQVLDRFLAFGQTTTSIVQSSPVPLRAPPFPAAAVTAGAAKKRKRR